MALAERDDLCQALGFYRPHEAFRVGVQVRTAHGKFHSLHTVGLQNRLEGVSEQPDKMVTSLKQSFEFPLSLKSLSQNYEVDLIKSALENCQYNQKKTADALELTYHQLRGYLKKYNLLDSSATEED